jgi:hypothetical protein
MRRILTEEPVVPRVEVAAPDPEPDQPHGRAERYVTDRRIPDRPRGPDARDDRHTSPVDLETGVCAVHRIGRVQDEHDVLRPRCIDGGLDRRVMPPTTSVHDQDAAGGRGYCGEGGGGGAGECTAERLGQALQSKRPELDVRAASS